MAKITVEYMPNHTDVGFLLIKQEYLSIKVWKAAFFVHIYTSMLVLFAGFTQFNSWIMKHRPSLHRLLGYVYVFNVLCITGPASLIMAWYANGGGGNRIVFIILALLWWFYTLFALLSAKQKKFTEHKVYMIKSFALTLSAISLRCWKVVFTNSWDFPFYVIPYLLSLFFLLKILYHLAKQKTLVPNLYYVFVILFAAIAIVFGTQQWHYNHVGEHQLMDVYRKTSILGWGANFVVAELYIYFFIVRKKSIQKEVSR
jgi:hypothetical protein